jgi:glutaminase
MTKITASKLNKLVKTSLENRSGRLANYIPELASVPEDYVSLTVQALGEEAVTVATEKNRKLTLQSSAKLIPLIGLLEEFGPKKVFSWVKVEPSGDDFASIARLDQFGPKASNPVINAGAITLCSFIPGEGEKKLAWLEDWFQKLFADPLSVNNLVLASEKRTGDRNRSLAYLLKSNGVIKSSVKETLETYFTLCSHQAEPERLIQLPYLLANDGKNQNGERIISSSTVQQTLAIMATCGLYNESGTNMVRTGMPAKSAVSGIILAVSPAKGAIVVASPKVNDKGNSVRGNQLLETLSNDYRWHFAAP